MPRLVRCAFVLSLGLLIIAPGVSAQDAADGTQGVIEGTVRDETTGVPVEDAVVSIEETGRQIETDSEGRFRIADLPSGTVTIRVAKASYGSVVERVDPTRVPMGRYEVLLPRMEAVLQGIVARGSRSASDASSSGRTVRADLNHDQTARDILANRVPGVSMATAFGEVGTGSNVRIRGVGSITGVTTPQIYLDGVRIDTYGPPDAPGVGRAMGILESIPAQDVSSIRVLSGPAAAVGYSEAANGVILIETVRGTDPDEDGNED